MEMGEEEMEKREVSLAGARGEGGGVLEGNRPLPTLSVVRCDGPIPIRMCTLQREIPGSRPAGVSSGTPLKSGYCPPLRIDDNVCVCHFNKKH